MALLGVALLVGRIDERLWFGRYRLGPPRSIRSRSCTALSGSAMISATLRVPKP